MIESDPATTDADLALPRDLGDGLVLRRPRMDDTEDLAAFNIRLHTDDPAEPEPWLGNWTRDLMSGRHPTTGPDDFTLVVDERADGAIVSTSVLISQTWSYDGVPFGCGRIELVGTDPEYRRRGLVRAQFDALHARSTRRGDLVQAITGIPWYYRQFGYEMALGLGGLRPYVWEREGNLADVDEERYQWRPATTDDVPVLDSLYAIHCRDSILRCVRDEPQWRWEISGPHAESPNHRDFRLIVDGDGEPVAYTEFGKWPPGIAIHELAVARGHPWRPVLAFLARTLKKEADAHNESAKKPIRWIHFALGVSHAAYEALGEQLEPQRGGYAWYLRVADLAGFLRHVAPTLDRRLAESVMAGHTGSLRLNFYTGQLTLEFAEGRLVDIGTFEPKQLAGGDALFPDLTFLQLVFGFRSLEELRRARPDCYWRNAEAAVLLNILFPKSHSRPVALG